MKSFFASLFKARAAFNVSTITHSEVCPKGVLLFSEKYAKRFCNRIVLGRKLHWIVAHARLLLVWLWNNLHENLFLRMMYGSSVTNLKINP